MKTADEDIGGIDCAGKNGVVNLLAGDGDLVRESESQNKSMSPSRRSRANAVDEPESTWSRRRTAVERTPREEEDVGINLTDGMTVLVVGLGRYPLESGRT
jgi:hypothetical protein